MSKRKNKKARIIPFGSKISLPNYIKKHARKLPIYKCYIVEGYEHEASTFAYVFREKKNGDLILGVYLINLWCRGLIESNFHEIKSYEKEEALNHFLNPDEAVEIVEIEANKLFNLIYGSIEFAENLGFEPDKTFKITEFILDAADTINYEEIEFGDNGMPTLIAENEDNLEAICAVLDKSVGRDGYDILYDKQELDPEFINDSQDRFVSLYAYSTYCKYKHRLMMIALMLDDDFKLAKHYLHHTEEFKLLIKNKLIELESDPMFLENLESEIEIYVSALEKYIMFLGNSFLEEDIFIDCFNTLLEEEFEEAYFDVDDFENDGDIEEEVFEEKDIEEKDFEEEDIEEEDFEESDFEEDIIFPENFDSFSESEKLDFFRKQLEDELDNLGLEDEEFFNQLNPHQLFANLINYTLLNTYGSNKIYMILHYYCEVNQLDSNNKKHLTEIREKLERFKQAGENLSQEELYLFHHLARHEEVFGRVDFETIVKNREAENDL